MVMNGEGDARARGAAAPRMPDLTQSRYGFSHTADSALTSLTRAGIGAERITLKSAGPGWQRDRVVQQQPPAGSALTPDVAVQLSVAGEGVFHYLPTGMRDSVLPRTSKGDDLAAMLAAQERLFGAEELSVLFDDPVEKLAYFVRQGGLYFGVRPENSLGCARWIRLFGVATEDWPRETWGLLAALLPWLHVLAGTEAGLRLALKHMLGLGLERVSRRPRVTRLAPDQLSELGRRGSQLGVDIVVGDGIENEAALQLTLGPVTLAEYERHTTAEGERAIGRVLRLVMPYHLEYVVDWLVGDPSAPPRLGEAAENSVLGVNSYLGWAAAGGL